MIVEQHLEHMKSRSLSKSRYFSPHNKNVLDEGFPSSEFWERLIHLDHLQQGDILRATFRAKDFDENECFNASVSSNGLAKSPSTTRKFCRLPALNDEPSKQYRISPRTAYFYLEFGCLRIVKPACGNKACVNPYHQMVESSFDGSDNSPETASNMVTIRKFVHGMDMETAIRLAHDAGYPASEIKTMPVLNFVNLAMAHSQYIEYGNRALSKRSVYLSIGAEQKPEEGKQE